jgi:ribosomal-protein-serine acetyltransferase
MNLFIDEQISLRQVTVMDASDIFNTMDQQRNYLGKWLPFVAYTNVLADTENYIASIVNAPADSFELVFTIRLQDEFVGLIGFKDTDKQNHKTEIGYWLSEHQQGKGIVTKSVAKLCQWAFGERSINRIQIKCASDNIPSKKIPKRLGFKLEGIERQGELLSSGNYTDLEVYSLLKSEFTALDNNT